MNSNYIEYKFNNILDDYIDCVWTDKNLSASKKQSKTFLIVPDNSVELIFSPSTIERRLINSNKVFKLKSHLSGLKTVAQNVSIEGDILLSVKIKPYKLYKFTNKNLKHTINASLATEDVFGTDIITLEEELFKNQTETHQLKLIENYFMKKLRSVNNNDLIFDFIIKKILNSKGNINLEDLVGTTNVSLKTIERKFYKYLGLSPKKYCRIVRIFNVLKTNKCKSKLSSIAIDNGFYDQTHFTKEVKAFTGMIPKDFFKSNQSFQVPIFSA